MRIRLSETFIFVAPAFIFTAAVLGLPLIGVVLSSIWDQTLQAPSFRAFREIGTSGLFYRVLGTTILISLQTMIVSLVLAYPLAYYLSLVSKSRRSFLMIFVLVPFWTSVLVKSFAFTVILGHDGVINVLLRALSLPTVELLYNRIGVVIGMSHIFIPFMVFPILSSLLSRPGNLVRVAGIMGASEARIFWRVVLPLSVPGIATGSLLVFVLSLGFFIAPAVLGGRQDVMLANLIEFYTREAVDWQMGSAVAMVLLGLSIIATFGFLYLPGAESLLRSSKK